MAAAAGPAKFEATGKSADGCRMSRFRWRIRSRQPEPNRFAGRSMRKEEQ